MSTLTMDLALKLCPGAKFDLIDFYENGTKNQFIHFAFTNYCYNYLLNNESSFHRILLKCFICHKKPEYGFKSKYGIGNICLMHNDINENEFLTWNKETANFQIVKKSKRHKRFICLCNHHVEHLELYTKAKSITLTQTTKQLSLF